MFKSKKKKKQKFKNNVKSIFMDELAYNKEFQKHLKILIKSYNKKYSQKLERLNELYQTHDKMLKMLYEIIKNDYKIVQAIEEETETEKTNSDSSILKTMIKKTTLLSDEDSQGTENVNLSGEDLELEKD